MTHPPYQNTLRARGRRYTPWILATLALAVVGAGIVIEYVHAALEPGPFPAIPRPSSIDLFDRTPVHLVVTADWQKVPRVVPAYLVDRDATLWREMHFEDWDAVSQPLRERALAAMAREFAWALNDPTRWARMRPIDWDDVPQPVRAIAVIRMARYWGRHYAVGGDYGLSAPLVANTLAAIIMVESWFEHRGTHRNADGSEDIGLGGASEYCRVTLRELQGAGRVDFAPADAQYLNPWHATRVVAIWFKLMLDEAGGDLDLAIAAYHAGITAAAQGDAADYVANVRRKRRRFIGNVGATPAWRFLFDRLLTRLVL